MTLRRSISLFGLISGGALAAYAIGKPSLRKQLAKTRSAEDAVDVLSTHIQKDGRKLMRNVRDKGGVRATWLDMKSKLRRADDVVADVADRAELAADEATKKAKAKA